MIHSFSTDTFDLNLKFHLFTISENHLGTLESLKKCLTFSISDQYIYREFQLHITWVLHREGSLIGFTLAAKLHQLDGKM